MSFENKYEKYNKLKKTKKFDNPKIELSFDEAYRSVKSDIENENISDDELIKIIAQISVTINDLRNDYLDHISDEYKRDIEYDDLYHLSFKDRNMERTLFNLSISLVDNMLEKFNDRGIL